MCFTFTLVHLFIGKCHTLGNTVYLSWITITIASICQAGNVNPYIYISFMYTEHQPLASEETGHTPATN